MLGMLLCSGRTAFEDDDEIMVGHQSSFGTVARRTRSGSSKRKISKGQIGGPVDFRHNAHMGYDDITGVENWDSIRWQQELEVRSTASSRSPTSPSFLASHTSRDAQTTTFQPSVEGVPQQLTRAPTLQSSPVRRKPVPSVPVTTAQSTLDPPSRPPISSAMPSGSTASIAALYHRATSAMDYNDPDQSRATSSSSEHDLSAGSSPLTPKAKALVPLLDPPPQLPGRKIKPAAGEAHYVTQTAKIRWDGAMAEIGKALREAN